MIRKIIHIDEEKCDGCVNCVDTKVGLCAMCRFFMERSDDSGGCRIVNSRGGLPVRSFFQRAYMGAEYVIHIFDYAAFNHAERTGTQFFGRLKENQSL